MTDWLRAAVVLPAVLLIGCASVDYDYPKTASTHVTKDNSSYLDQRVSRAVAARPDGTSGFYPLSNGIDALGARLRLANLAQRSIDVQYYLIKWDLTGRQFFWELLQAADRGVRVRLMIDDMFTSGYDRRLMALEAHPNFEVRVFNPFNRGPVGRSLGAVTRIGQINRRMHNKSFTIDNQVTVIGGRNIADEYFGAGAESAFGDLDVMAIGPVVQDVSTMFDLYWAHRASLPAPAFLSELENPQAALQLLRDELAAHENQLLLTPYAEAVKERLIDMIEVDGILPAWSTYKLIYDSPDKGIKGRASPEQLITAPILRSLATAEKEELIVSPYFVPLRTFTDALVAGEAKGIDIRVITNSLAANNQKTVHGGYAPYRKELLRGGVELFEVRPDLRVAGAEYVPGDSKRATLHTKAYILDRREVFIGSFNFDPRSSRINTEMGVLIHNPELAGIFLEGIERALDASVWKLSLDDRGKIIWTGTEPNGESLVHRREPKTNWWQRFMAGVYRALPIRSQL